MRVGLLEFPRRSTLPNVALMRLSAYHKALGDEVILSATPLDHPDVVYLSTLFTWQRRAVEEVAAQFRPHADVQIGGPGVLPLVARLPAEVDAMPNDYDLFDVDFGLGYSSRGCIRHCRFCPVPKIEGSIHEASAIADLLNPRSNRLLLLDNNFFASDWRPKVAEIQGRGLHVCWPQGLDIRLLDSDQAAALADLRRRGQLWNQRFSRRGVLHFAWDLPSNEARSEEVVRGVRLLLSSGFTPNDLSFMVLVGFPGYSLEDELERIIALQTLGIQPYVMVYRDYGEQDRRDIRRMDLQHWNNGHVWRSVPFQDYRRTAA
jgi:hypothetical protein